MARAGANRRARKPPCARNAVCDIRQRKIHTARPKKGTAQRAWDFFTDDKGAEPVRMWFTFLSYWCWVAEWPNGDTDDIDSLELRPAITTSSETGPEETA